jgi:predicted acylesterase/phospholipase RssA
MGLRRGLSRAGLSAGAIILRGIKEVLDLRILLIASQNRRTGCAVEHEPRRLATDILSGHAVVLSESSAAAAIIASTAIPAAFAPVPFDGRYLADGAITSCTPVRVAVEKGAKRLIVLQTGYACACQSPPLARSPARCMR